MQIPYVHRILGNVVTEVVCHAKSCSGADSASGHPNRKASWMMVAAPFGAVPFSLASYASSKLTAPDYERLIKQAALFEVLDECGTRSVRISASRCTPRAEATVMVPVGVKQLHESDTSLDKSAGQYAVCRVGSRSSRVGTVHFKCGFRFVA